MDLCFTVHKLAKFSSNTGKVHFDSLVHLLIYIRENNNLGLKYYPKIEDAPPSDLLRQDIIKTDNQLLILSDSSFQDFPDTGINKGAYIVFYQGGPIDNCTHFPVTVDKSSADSEYNAACNVGMALYNFRMLNNEFLNKDTDLVPEQAILIILYRKSAICMAKNGKDTKHIRHIYKIMHLVRNCE